MQDLLNKYNFDDKYAKKALERVMKAIVKVRPNLGVPPPKYNGPESFLDG